MRISFLLHGGQGGPHGHSNGVFGWFEEQWLEYAEWLTGTPSAEAGGLATALLFILFGSIVLGLVMALKGPRTLLEKVLFVREFFLVFLLSQFFVGLILGPTSFWLRLIAYGGAGIASLVIAFVIFKEYTFDVWELQQRQKYIDEDQRQINQRQATLDAEKKRPTVKRQHVLDEDQHQLTDRQITLDHDVDETQTRG